MKGEEKYTFQKRSPFEKSLSQIASAEKGTSLRIFRREIDLDAPISVRYIVQSISVQAVQAVGCRFKWSVEITIATLQFKSADFQDIIPIF